MTYKKVLALARAMRKNPTPAEKHFWQLVRNGKISGYRLQRQFIIKYCSTDKIDWYFIADFYCHPVKLVIELDGPIHEDQKEYDRVRERTLIGLGYIIIRFQNFEIFTDWENVKSKIIAAINPMKK